ncbi:hypothetical protein, variant 1 [Aphanomyces astaci]|uniref:Histone deacetylase interacting domain-containing protein n=1 Tax=Aphanomyces astaci TaxID=112090 RepID=W4GSI5_APHAT|nr:hypothetical protein, variant 1 [Aphanomyces astaci]ETV81979.1 hypothetical protein, variant 1 [Aphanomyces astaci]|eukprot:XP_009828716.1 hypothetical protein, variant 1 [Aphanomyces astaci]
MTVYKQRSLKSTTGLRHRNLAVSPSRKMRPRTCIRIDTSQVIRQISELFRGHPHLILGFNAFLPSDQRIQPNSLDLHPLSSAIDQTLPPPAITPNATSTPSQQIRPQNQGQLYLDQVKHQLTDQPELFKQFLSLMKAFQADTLNTRDVVRRIEVLFHGHPDLVTGFLTFLPPGDPVLEQVASTHHTQTT